MDNEKKITVICTETGRGSKASIYICSQHGYDGAKDYIITAYKDAPYTYRIVSDKPKGISLVIKAGNREGVRKFLEQYIANLILSDPR